MDTRGHYIPYLWQSPGDIPNDGECYLLYTPLRRDLIVTLRALAFTAMVTARAQATEPMIR